MTVTVYMDEVGAVWIANVQGDILAEGFFKTSTVVSSWFWG